MQACLRGFNSSPEVHVSSVHVLTAVGLQLATGSEKLVKDIDADLTLPRQHITDTCLSQFTGVVDDMRALAESNAILDILKKSGPKPSKETKQMLDKETQSKGAKQLHKLWMKFKTC